MLYVIALYYDGVLENFARDYNGNALLFSTSEAAEIYLRINHFGKYTAKVERYSGTYV